MLQKRVEDFPPESLSPHGKDMREVTVEVSLLYKYIPLKAYRIPPLGQAVFSAIANYVKELEKRRRLERSAVGSHL